MIPFGWSAFWRCLMTSAWMLGATAGVPQDESDVRSTVEPIRDKADTVESDKAPDYNEVQTDESGELVGLSPRQVASAVTDSVQSAPWWAHLATVNHNQIIDDQVATSGTAAKREDAGQAGHGTMLITEGIEPVIRDGAAYGNDYFVGNETVIQEGAGDFMAPVDTDNWNSAIAQAVAVKRSRAAFQDTQYGAFLAGG